MAKTRTMMGCQCNYGALMLHINIVTHGITISHKWEMTAADDMRWRTRTDTRTVAVDERGKRHQQTRGEDDDGLEVTSWGVEVEGALPDYSLVGRWGGRKLSGIVVMVFDINVTRGLFLPAVQGLPPPFSRQPKQPWTKWGGGNRFHNPLLPPAPPKVFLKSAPLFSPR